MVVSGVQVAPIVSGGGPPGTTMRRRRGGVLVTDGRTAGVAEIGAVDGRERRRKFVCDFAAGGVEDEVESGREADTRDSGAADGERQTDPRRDAFAANRDEAAGAEVEQLVATDLERDVAGPEDSQVIADLLEQEAPPPSRTPRIVTSAVTKMRTVSRSMATISVSRLG